jgi:hypothetical protein
MLQLLFILITQPIDTQVCDKVNVHEGVLLELHVELEPELVDELELEFEFHHFIFCSNNEL